MLIYMGANNKRKTTEQYINEVYDLVGEEYTVLGEYVSSKTKILMRHNDCGNEWEITPNGFLRGNRCSNHKKTTEQFKQEVFERFGNKYEVLGEYITNKTNIRVKHTVCGREWEVRPCNFLFHPRAGCEPCSRKRVATQRSKGFDKFSQEIKLLSDEFELISEYKNVNTKIKVKHLICGVEWNVLPLNLIKSLKLNSHGCPNCDPNKKSTYQMTHQDFVNRIKEVHGDSYTVIGEYANMKTIVEVQHNICGYKWMAFPNTLLRSKYGEGCQNCAGNMKRTTEEFKGLVKNLVGNEYIVLGEYVNANTKILMHHVTNCGYQWEITPASFITMGTRCPECNKSKGERKLQEFLILNKIVFKEQYSFDNLKGVGGHLLRFDFSIFSNKNKLLCLIEYDGEFHYFNKYDGDGYETTKIHDERKNKYCKENNISLIRIPYWEYDNLENLLTEELQKIGLQFPVAL